MKHSIIFLRPVAFGVLTLFTLLWIASIQTAAGENTAFAYQGRRDAADALINTWTGKLEYPTWRPITAINEGDFDGDPKTIGDVNWQPLINTPNYPDHSSGANALVSGVMKMLALYFGTDEVTFTVTSTNPNANPNSRTYASFTDAALDVVEALSSGFA